MNGWSAIFLLCAVAEVMGGSGCVLIGGVLGVGVDQGLERVLVIAPSNLPLLGSNQNVHVTTKAGQILKGVYLGAAFTDSAQYRMRYEAGRPPALPSLGDSVRLQPTLGPDVAGRFAGLDPASLLILRDGRIEAHDLQFVATLSTLGSPTVTADSLRAFERTGAWPNRSGILLGPPYERSRRSVFESDGMNAYARAAAMGSIPLDDIAAIVIVHHPTFGAAFCGLGGLAMDIAWWMWLQENPLFGGLN